MMKTLYKTAIIAVAAIIMTLAGGCTKNDGDPFGLYGVWHLVSVETTTDGTTVIPDTPANTYIAFQNDVVKFYSNDGYVGTSESYAKLAAEGDHYLCTYLTAHGDAGYITVRWDIERKGNSLTITEHRDSPQPTVIVRRYEKV